MKAKKVVTPKPKATYIKNQLFVGAFSGKVFLAPRVKVVAVGTSLEHYEVVGAKYDVTQSFDEAVKARARYLRRKQKERKANP